MSIVRHHRQEQFAPDGDYARGLCVPMDTDEDDDWGLGGSPVVKTDSKAHRYLDPNPNATNADLRGSFERLEPRRRSHLRGPLAEQTVEVDGKKLTTVVYGKLKLTPDVIFAYRSGGTTKEGRYGLRRLCSRCRRHKDPKCHVCTTDQKVPENPRFEDWCEYLTGRADALLMKAAKEEFKAMGGSTQPGIMEEWLEATNPTFRTRSDSPPPVYSHLDESGRYVPSHYIPD